MKLTDLSLDYRECAGCGKPAYPHNRFTACIEGLYGMVENIRHFCVDCSHPEQVLPSMAIGGGLYLSGNEVSRYMSYINKIYKDYQCS